jgi:hypothetical protein
MQKIRHRHAVSFTFQHCVTSTKLNKPSPSQSQSQYFLLTMSTTASEQDCLQQYHHLGGPSLTVSRPTYFPGFFSPSKPQLPAISETSPLHMDPGYWRPIDYPSHPVHWITNRRLRRPISYISVQPPMVVSSPLKADYFLDESEVNNLTPSPASSEPDDDEVKSGPLRDFCLSILIPLAIAFGELALLCLAVALATVKLPIIWIERKLSDFGGLKALREFVIILVLTLIVSLFLPGFGGTEVQAIQPVVTDPPLYIIHMRNPHQFGKSQPLKHRLILSLTRCSRSRRWYDRRYLVRTSGRLSLSSRRLSPAWVRTAVLVSNKRFESFRYPFCDSISLL